jgi:hypothetical protein
MWEVGHGPTPWADNVYSLSGDIINGPLSTIYQFPDNAFQLVNMGNAFYVPISTPIPPLNFSYPLTRMK